MRITPYHAKFYAHSLSLSGGSGLERIDRALFDASVDVNPHQVEAALFALRSPLSQGVLLADEVGLGKTIEAGLVLCQLWAERKRSLLVISPASLRKQWEGELTEKFNLPAVILDAKIYKQLKRNGLTDPFSQPAIIICSFHFAATHHSELQLTNWDLVVIDEAHKLRNAYRESNRIGQLLKKALADKRKILLTATPLQNSLLELYGLSTFIDEKLFGEVASFRTRYMRADADLNGLRARIGVFCRRTLRRQVQEYVRYTERHLITRPFLPSEREHNLYESVSAYLQRENTFAVPNAQRHLLVLLVRKVLASSPTAVAGTLEIMKRRLEALLDATVAGLPVLQRALTTDELDDDLLDELLEDDEDTIESTGIDTQEIAEPKIDIEQLKKEISELSDYIRWAHSLGVDAKAKALLAALEIGFDKLAKNNAAQKVVIFTESRRTQQFLVQFLESNGYGGRIVTFNGTNKDDTSGRIFEEWLRINRNSTKVSGSKSIDLRAAIIDRFRNDADILIATEAGAEGLNLQFCSAIINYDLPWNPQRIEQRIGRCHRYGQRHDVVVINFLNQRNYADQRVLELLTHKFQLFEGVFGASDDVLGSIESGIDFEKRVLEIYQQCRSQDEIQARFDALRAELDEQIQSRMAETRKTLLDHFDAEVHDRLKANLEGTRIRLNQMARQFWSLTKYLLETNATFDDTELRFHLQKSPITDAEPGTYQLATQTSNQGTGSFLYRLGHPLGQFVLKSGMDIVTPLATVQFDVTHHPVRIAPLIPLVGKRGLLQVQKVTISAFETQEYLLTTAITDDGNSIDPETATLLFSVSGRHRQAQSSSEDDHQKLTQAADQHVKGTLSRNAEANNRHFTEVKSQLDRWAQDMEDAAEKEIKDCKARIRELERQARQALTMEEKLRLEKETARMEKQKTDLRRNLFAVEDEIREKRKLLIDGIERRLKQTCEVTPLFSIAWEVV